MSERDPHTWTISKLGHGETMCVRCFMTNREAAALGMAMKCEPIKDDGEPKPGDGPNV